MTISTWIGRRGRTAAAGLLLAAAITFLVGIAVEHATSSPHKESAVATSTESTQSEGSSSSATHADSDTGEGAQPQPVQPEPKAGTREPSATSEERVSLAAVTKGLHIAAAGFVIAWLASAIRRGRTAGT